MEFSFGEYTKTIYTLINRNRYVEAIDVILNIPGAEMTRSGLSLLGFCYYYTQDFYSAANCYEQLTIVYPNIAEYKLYYAQCLYQACMYDKAFKVVNDIKNSEFQNELIKLKAAIKYGEEDLNVAKNFVDSLPKDHADTDANLACLLYKEGRYEDALARFLQALQVSGSKPHLLYNVALTYFRLKDYQLSKKYISDIIDKGIREHPELSVGTVTEGIESHSVGNTLALHQTALIEAFNLKAAIEYNLNNEQAAHEALTDMPPRNEPELDAVTLHNQAILSVSFSDKKGPILLTKTKPLNEKNLEDAFEKLQFLLQQNQFPAETFSNLLLLYCQVERHEIAADILAENAEFTYRYLTPYLYEYLDALITRETNSQEAYLKLDAMSSRLTDSLRKLTKTVQEAREKNDTQTVKNAVLEYDECLSKFITVLMAQAKIYWDLAEYEKVERLFQKSAEFCSDHEIWKLNVAHTLFMQGNKYKEAASFYEPLIRIHYGNILSVSAIALANLCVCYIMTSQNENAEELMRKIEREEEQNLIYENQKSTNHLCIVNIVIGTLYCSKGNYEFGISRVIKSLDPPTINKLSTESWLYAKTCFINMCENLSTNTLVLRDNVLHECIRFLEMCEANGGSVSTFISKEVKLNGSNYNGELSNDQHKTKTIACEARLLKYLLIRIIKE